MSNNTPVELGASLCPYLRSRPKSKRVDHPNNEITTKNNVPSNNVKILKTLTFISPSVVFFLNVFWISTAASSSDTEYFMLRITGAESSPVYTLSPPTYKTNKQTKTVKCVVVTRDELATTTTTPNTAWQHCCDIVSNDYNIVPTVQRCVVLKGSLSNDDGDGSHNGKKAIGVDWQNNNSAHASRFLVNFLAVIARLQR